MTILGYELRKTEEAEPGKKTTRIGVAKIILLTSGMLAAGIDVLNHDYPEWADAAPWLGVVVLANQLLGAIANMMSQDKKFHGQNTASRAVYDEGVPTVAPEVAAAIPTIAPEIAAAIADNVAKAIQRSRDEQALRDLMQQDAEKRVEAGLTEGG